MLESKNFFKSFLIGFVLCALPLFVCYLIFYKVGEVEIESVVDRQLSDADKYKILFSSGLNQAAFPYKIKLMQRVKPDVVALGSSRAMQVRGEFIHGRFVNLGGVIQGVTDIEDYADFINLNQNKPDLTLFFIDPWWFNLEFAGNGGAHQIAYPRMISMDHLVGSLKLFSKGNWFVKSFESTNLGIASILTGEGFASDGSYHYTNLISVDGVADDVHFLNTLERIKNRNQRFEKGYHFEPILMQRACTAISNIKRNSKNLVLIAPPFASIIWREIKGNPDYFYIEESYSHLEKCLGQPVYKYLSMDTIDSPKNDCEFIDGYHGGDTAYARVLNDLAVKNQDVSNYIDKRFLQSFIKNESGYAGGGSRRYLINKNEIDFLKLGCHK